MGHDSDRAIDEARTDDGFRLRAIALAGFVAVNALLGAVAWPFAPSEVPTHFDLRLRADDVGPKWLGLFAMPVVMLATGVLVLVAERRAGGADGGRFGIGVTVMPFVLTALQAYIVYRAVTL